MKEELKTPMDASAASWLSDLEMDDYNLFPEECPLNLLDVDDEEFLSHDIASALEGKALQQSLSPECTSITLSNSSTDETSFDFERPTKVLKTISTSCNSSSITENFSSKLSPSPSISSFQSQILSFDNSNASPANTTQFYGFDCALNPNQNDVVSVSLSQLGNKHFPTQTPNGSSKNQNFETKTSQTKRSPLHAQDHIMAERKRREKLSQSFIALAALVPGLKKMDKASVLGDAIKYVKELKERLAVLEEQGKKTRVESVMVLNKPELSGDDDSSSCDESVDAAGATESLLQVEARVSGQEMLIRIHSQKQKGLLVKILAEIQNLHLFVINSNVLPFGKSIIDITIIAQMGDGYNLTIKGLVKNLRAAICKFMSQHVA
ncbi:transcription factor bHLH18-like [Gastrolobium bilobum]|uniref:transcription factor bHLH18-like n=1 Tax=Gastrolobium bilobum TaxID=150636 RepID=UPI002AB3133A|nr:transcription factor bHLH18-like [Gastrolobium bilobum]